MTLACYEIAMWHAIRCPGEASTAGGVTFSQIAHLVDRPFLHDRTAVHHHPDLPLPESLRAG